HRSAGWKGFSRPCWQEMTIRFSAKICSGHGRRRSTSTGSSSGIRGGSNSNCAGVMATPVSTSSGEKSAGSGVRDRFDGRQVVSADGNKIRTGKVLPRHGVIEQIDVLFVNSADQKSVRLQQVKKILQQKAGVNIQRTVLELDQPDFAGGQGVAKTAQNF